MFFSVISQRDMAKLLVPCNAPLVRVFSGCSERSVFTVSCEDSLQTPRKGLSEILAMVYAVVVFIRFRKQRVPGLPGGVIAHLAV